MLLRIRGYPSTFTPVVWPQHISNWQHHFLCSRRSTEHMYIGHYLYSFHAHGTLFCALSVRTIMTKLHQRSIFLVGKGELLWPSLVRAHAGKVNWFKTLNYKFVFPTGTLPIGTLLTGTLLTGTLLTVTLPTGTLLTGTLPTGTLLTGTLLTRTLLTRTLPTGTPDTISAFYNLRSASGDLESRNMFHITYCFWFSYFYLATDCVCLCVEKRDTTEWMAQGKFKT